MGKRIEGLYIRRMRKTRKERNGNAGLDRGLRIDARGQGRRWFAVRQADEVVAGSILGFGAPVYPCVCVYACASARVRVHGCGARIRRVDRK